MRTFTTEKGVEYDVEVLDVLNTSTESHIMVEATIEQGTKMFWVSFNNRGESPDKDQVHDLIDQDDLIEVEKWILEKTFGWVEANQYNTSELPNQWYDVLCRNGDINKHLTNIMVCYLFNEEKATHFRKHLHND